MVADPVLPAFNAFRIPVNVGDANGEADAAQLTAHVLWLKDGDLAGAVALYEQALAAYRLSGNRRGLAQGLLKSGYGGYLLELLQR